MITKIKITFYLTFSLLIISLGLYYASTILPSNFFEREEKVWLEELDVKNYVLLTDGCKVPRYDPFDETVIEFYNKTGGDIPCEGKQYLKISENKVILLHENFQEDFPGQSFVCSYNAILRNPKNETLHADDKFGFGEERKLRIGDYLPAEFVKVICKVNGKQVYEEYLASTPLKDDVEERCEQKLLTRNIQDKLNILVIGIDSISKLNFERHFKLTADYLRNNLSVFEFNGYMKVADNTLPNLTPMLTGHFIEHYITSKDPSSNQSRYFDDLDFIWKSFSSLGYRTLLAEDAPCMAIYNYIKNGFQFPPTDYFFRPFTLAIEDSPWFVKSKTDCFQAQPEITVLFNFLQSFLTTMRKRPFFALTWAARLTHGTLNKAGYADKPSFELLRDVYSMGLFNNSMVIFMSDHGIRFGGIRKTYIGKIEERMPFLFLSLPKWFLDAHPEIAKNLATNQDRLTTPFDLHETLVDIYQMISGDTNYKSTPYGTSLFQEISSDRNCKSAYILPHWCVCHSYHKRRRDDDLAMRAAGSVIESVNNRTNPYRELCAYLTMDEILDVRASKPITAMLKYKDLMYLGDEDSVIFGDTEVETYVELLVTIRAKPGGAEFESTVRSFEDRFVVSDISRINRYGTQGDCVSDSELHKYCYCSS